MTQINKKYKKILNRIKELEEELERIKDQELNKTLAFGKYKGKTIREVYREDRQYIDWLIQNTQFEIDPRILGHKLPTREDILNMISKRSTLDIRGNSSTYRGSFDDGKIKVIHSTYTPAEYDTWNSGHYGCRGGELVKESESSYDQRIYTYEEFFNTYEYKLREEFPFIKWTFDLFKSIITDNY